MSISYDYNHYTTGTITPRAPPFSIVLIPLGIILPPTMNKYKVGVGTLALVWQQVEEKEKVWIESC